MTDPTLNQYLIDSKTDINHKAVDLLVMGNEASDLDSMASSIAFAYITAANEKDKTIVPVMPIIKADFKLRTEVVYVFEQAGINPDNIIFMDEIDIERLLDRTTGLALMDHNKLSKGFEGHGHKVSVILDHHKDEALYPHARKRIIEPVGSTATLVGELLSEDSSGLADTHLAMLLTGTILLDTVNLDPGAGRVTPKDEAVAKILMKTCSFEQDHYFQAVRKAKFNTADLSTFDLLRKDYKEFKFGSIRCGIASALLPMVQWGERDGKLGLGFESYVQQRHLDILISMNAYTTPGFSRDLAVYCTDPAIHDKLVDFLGKNGLELETLCLESPKTCLQGKISFHIQKNLEISRKKLSPMLDGYFTR